MTRAQCSNPPQELLEYWLGELDEARELTVEEHLFACAACSKKLEGIASLGAAIRAELLRGAFSFVTSAPFIRRIKEAGWQVREYELPAGGRRRRHDDSTVALVGTHRGADLLQRYALDAAPVEQA